MTTQAQQQPIEQLAPWKLATILFLLSFATVVFTIVLFRLLTFFIMPSLFFDLLFIGFPLGALAGVYFYTVSKQSFLKTLWILQGAMLFSILAMLACKHFDYLRAHLFDVELQRLFHQMLIFTLFFLPFFIAYGLSEYIGYQMGRRTLSFLLITGMGSTFIKPAMRPLFQVIGGLFILLLLLVQDSLSPLANLALIAPVAFVTGSFFPALFEAAAENPLGVFAADSIGAAIGSMASFFIPIVFGFDWFFVFATVIFWATAFATFLFFRNLKSAAAD